MINDTNGNPALALSVNNSLAVQPGDFTVDSTPPQLLSTGFSLDMDSGVITLTFDKVILVNEIMYGDIVIQSNPVSTATSVTLTTGTAISNNSAIVTIRDITF